MISDTPLPLLIRDILNGNVFIYLWCCIIVALTVFQKRIRYNLTMGIHKSMHMAILLLFCSFGFSKQFHG